MQNPNVIIQKNWTDDELRTEGFAPYNIRKSRRFSRILPPDESPLTIHLTQWDTVEIEAGYHIVFFAGDILQKTLYDYEHWPVSPQHYALTYADWDEPFTPSPTEAHLISLGCVPCYKFAGIWAKKLTEPTYVQSVESSQPVLLPPGIWVGIGATGEPWHMEDEQFNRRYYTEASHE